MLDIRFMKTLAQDIRAYDKMKKAFSDNNASEADFDEAFSKLTTTLGRQEANHLFSVPMRDLNIQLNTDERIPERFQNDVEAFLDFEARLIAPIFGSKKASLPTLKVAMSVENGEIEELSTTAIQEFKKLHEKSKDIIKKSRKKTRKEKIFDKRTAGVSLARLMIGIACVATNHFFMPEFSKESAAAGFSAIGLAAKALKT